MSLTISTEGGGEDFAKLQPGIYEGTCFRIVDLGTREKLNAAKELLDRTGIVKTEKMQVETSGGIMLLPAKKEDA